MTIVTSSRVQPARTRKPTSPARPANKGIDTTSVQASSPDESTPRPRNPRAVALPLDACSPPPAHQHDATQGRAAPLATTLCEEAQREAAQRDATPYDAEQREAAKRDATPYDAEQCEVAKQDATLNDATWRETEQCEAAKRDAAQTEATPYDFAQYDVIPANATRHHDALLSRSVGHGLIQRDTAMGVKGQHVAASPVANESPGRVTGSSHSIADTLLLQAVENDADVRQQARGRGVSTDQVLRPNRAATSDNKQATMFPPHAAARTGHNGRNAVHTGHRRSNASPSGAALKHNKSADYEVGYGKPPVKTRFKKGQSGNAKGRPRFAKNIKTILEEEINALVTYTENGKVTKATKTRLAIKSAMNKAAKGDLKALQIISKLLQDLSPRMLHGETHDMHKAGKDMSRVDLEILEAYGFGGRKPLASSPEKSALSADPAAPSAPLGSSTQEEDAMSSIVKPGT